MAIELADILAGVNAVNSKVNETISTVLGDSGAFQELEKERVANQEQIGKDSSTIVRQQAQGALDSQEATRKLGTTLGANIEDSSQIVISLADQMKNEYQAANAALDKVHAARSADIFSDPLGYLAGIFQTPKAIEEYQYHANKYNLAEAALSGINSAVQESSKAQASLARTSTIETVNAAADLETRKALENSARIKAEAIQANSAAVRDVMNLTQAQLSNQIAGYNLVQQDAQRDLQRQSLQLALDERTERLTQKKQTDADNEAIASDVRTGFAVLKGSPINVPTSKILQMLTMQNETGELFRKALQAGQNTYIYGKPTISDDPGKAAAALLSTGTDLPPEMKTVQQTLETAVTNATQQATLQGIKDIKQVQEMISQDARAIAEQQAKSIKHNDFSNMYMAPNVETVGSQKAVASSRFFQQIIKPQADAGMTDSDPEQLMKLAISAIAENKISLSDAQLGLTLYFQAAVAINNQSKDYSRVGLPNQKNYVTPINDGQSYRPVDMTDAVQVSSALSKRMSKIAMQKRLGVYYPEKYAVEPK